MKWFIAILVVLVILIGLGMYLSSSATGHNGTQQPATSTNSTSSSISVVTATTSASTSTTDMSEYVVIETPKLGAEVAKKFEVKGRARGNWYFEASLPVSVLDKDGKQLWIGPAQAEGDWMTTEFVPFTVTADAGTYTGAAMLVIAKDNPSGLPEHDASTTIPIIIK